MKKVCVCGGRNYTDKARVYRALDTARRILGEITVIHGDANGADRLADQWARDREQKVLVFPAQWKLHDKAAGPIRNREMLKFGFDFLIAFPGGSGTADMVKITMNSNIPVLQIYE